MTEQIEHEGVIDSIDAREIHVRIVSESACSSCHAKGACSAADLQDKMIDIPNDGKEYRIGQRVVIAGKKSEGFKAVFIAYIIPSVIMLCALVAVNATTGNDVLSGLTALASVAVYYTMVYFFRGYLAQSFSFHIKQS